MAYTGPTFRGVDYSPTWPTWSPSQGTQTGDSDFANDAFASFWSDKFRTPPAGGGSVPVDNTPNYRDDLATMQKYGFNLVRLYNWNMDRGTKPPNATGPSPDHINFLDHAHALGLKVVVPVSDYFLGEDGSSWAGQAPDSAYSFGSATQSIQEDCNLLVASLTDPRTNLIHAAVHSISVGNEGDYGQGGLAGVTTPSNFLARTIWWIVNLRQKIADIGPNVMLSATFSNGDQGGSTGSWFKCVIDGATAGQNTPAGCGLKIVHPHEHTQPWFDVAVTGLSAADPAYASYYYNSTNIGQNGTGLTQTLGLYDRGASPWPGGAMNVPLLFMEVFTNNRDQYPDGNFSTQAAAALNRINALETYLKGHGANTSASSTWLMGYNYFEFNDEPSPQLKKHTGLFAYGSSSNAAQTGTTSLWYGTTFANMSFNVHALNPNPGPTASQTLPAAIQAAFPSVPNVMGTIQATSGNAGNWTALFEPLSSSSLRGIVPGMFVTGNGIPAGTAVLKKAATTLVMTSHSTAASNPFPARGSNATLSFAG